MTFGFLFHSIWIVNAYHYVIEKVRQRFLHYLHSTMTKYFYQAMTEIRIKQLFVLKVFKFCHFDLIFLTDAIAFVC